MRYVFLSLAFLVLLPSFLFADIPYRIGEDVEVYARSKWSLGRVVEINRNRGIYCEYKTTYGCLLYTSPSPRDQRGSRMPSSA